MQDKIDAQLKGDGWKKDSYDAEMRLIDPTISLEHKYFTVFYEYI